MKQFIYSIFLMTIMSLTFVACSDDDGDEPDPTTEFDAPTITAPTNASVEVGNTVDLSFSVNAAGTIASVTTSASSGSASVTNATALTGTTSGTATVSFAAPTTAGSHTVTLNVSDSQTPAKSVSATATVDVTAEPSAPVKEVFASDSGTGTTTWSADTVYQLGGFIFVNDGQTLTIEPGTIIKGQPGTGSGASALIVARGGKLQADGTATAPIIFTSTSDEIQPGETVSTLPAATRGLWGGLIILGKAGLNSTPGETQIEGIPITEPRGIYGGSDDMDNSGSLSYISVRFGGTEIGAGNEINGITFGGVGAGTTVHHCEVVANKDDGIEFFGGTVNTKYMVVANVADDSFDFDEGYRGKNQFWVVIQDDAGDRGGEHDGGTDPETAQPFGNPIIYNATFIGNGVSRAITLRDNCGASYYNSIFTGFGKGIDIELLESGTGAITDSWKQLDAGNLVIKDNIMFNIGADIFTVVTSGDKATPADLTAAQAAADTYLTDNGNTVVDPMLSGMVPDAAGPAGTATGLAGDSFIEEVSFKGAFAPGATKWIEGWTVSGTL